MDLALIVAVVMFLLATLAGVRAARLWVLLDQHPDEQEGLRAELVTTTGGCSAPTTSAARRLRRAIS